MSAIKCNKDTCIVCIPYYNLPELTISCITYLLKSQGIRMQIRLCDDGSDDSTKAQIQEYIASVVKRYNVEFLLVVSEKNKGFSCAVNNLLVLVEGNDIPFVLLNNDCQVTPNCIRLMLEDLHDYPHLACTSPYTNAVGVCSLFREHELAEHYHRHAEVDVRFLESMEHAPIPQRIVTKKMVPFFCTALQPQALMDVGKLDDAIFTNGLGADDDWCIRARKKDYMIGLSCRSYAPHIGHATFNHHKIPRSTREAHAKLRYKWESTR